MNHDTTINKKYLSLLLPVMIAAILLLMFLKNHSITDEPIDKSAFYFNTIINIRLYDSRDESLIDACFDIAEKYEQYFSRTRTDSDIYRINHAHGKPVEVHPETIDLIQKGIYYSSISQGTFDITIGALTELWNIPENTSEIPPADAISSALATVDYTQIRLTDHTVQLMNPDARLDLGALAKGYAADAMKSYLNEHHVHSGIINLGGNVLTIGTKESGKTYHIAIQRPFSDSGEPITTVDVTDSSVVTSGRYERYFEKDGRIYHHIIDLADGYPCNTDLNGVTILSASSLEGDAFSTICFAMGEEKAAEFLKNYQEATAIYITDSNEVHK